MFSFLPIGRCGCSYSDVEQEGRNSFTTVLFIQRTHTQVEKLKRKAWSAGYHGISDVT